MVTAGAIALGPMVVAPPTQVAAAAPTIHVDDIALTGIGQAIYYAITPVVQDVVSWAQYGVSFVPFIGPPIADQIGINYFAGIQPIVEATVNYAAAVINNPLNFFPITGAYGNTLFGIGYGYVSAQLGFFGLPPLPPIVASVPAAVAASSGPGDIPAAVAPAVKRVNVVEDAVKSVVAAQTQARAEVRAAARSARVEARQAVASAVAEVRAAAATGSPSEVADAAQQAGSEVRTAVKSARSEVRATAKAARGEVRAAVKAARDSVKAAGEAAE